jgi:hypothetical protein
MVDAIRIQGYGPESEMAHDKVDGVQYPITKQAFGPDGQAIPVEVTNPLPVQMQAAADRPDFDAATDPQKLVAIESPGLADFLEAVVDQPWGLQVNVAPMGLQRPGQQAAAQSMPVALANEQILDAVIQGAPQLGGLGNNIVLPNQVGALWLDCLQYRSIALQIVSAAGVAGTVAFEGSNDGITGVVLPLWDQFAFTSLPATGYTLAAGSRYFVGALPFRYFRVRISTTVTGGLVYGIARLSMAPFAWAGSYSVNLAFLNNTAIPSAGVAGIMPVGGNVAPGVAPTANPVQVGGVDVVLGRTRRILTDFFGNQTVVGPDPSQSGHGVTQPVLVRDAISGTGLDAPDLLFRILLELRSVTHYLKELPLHLNQGYAFTDEAPYDYADEGKLQN